jgi:L-ribulose-5-phosphate 3-epimerase
MLKSISVWAFDPARPLPEVFKMAKDNGFEGVEVAIGSEGPITPQSTEDDCKRIVEQAQAAGIKLASLASGLGWQFPITTTDDATREEGLKVIKSSLWAAKWLGVDAILVVPGGVGAEFIDGFKGAPYDVAYANTVAGLNKLKGVAEETGVSIGIENVWNKFLLSPLEMRDLIDEIDSPQVGAYFDVGNVILTGYAEQWINILGKRIKRVHFKDFKREVGTLDGFCDLLDGDVNFPACMKALREAGYNGPVTSEFFNCEGDLAKISKAMDAIAKM